MSPQQYLAATLLESTQFELRETLAQRMANNPAIEDIQWKDQPVVSAITAPAPGAGKSAADADVPLDFTPEGPAAERMLAEGGVRDEFFVNSEGGGADDWADGRLTSVRDASSAYDAAREERRNHFFESTVRAESFDEHLRRQIGLADFSPRERLIAERVVGGIDEAGYFTVPVAELMMGADFTADEVERVLKRIRETFDPPGVGARDLRECLLAQMERLEDSPWEDEVRAVIETYLDDLLAGREDRIRAALNLDPDEWRHVKECFRLFSRKPALQRMDAADGGAGRRVGNDEPQYVYPEVTAVRKHGAWRAVVSDGSLPRIVISKTYRRLSGDSRLSASERETIRNYVNGAEELEDLLSDRQEKLRLVAQAVIDAQPEFFAHGFAGLKPLSQARIAERTNLDPSLVSRAIKGKYMRTPFGAVEISALFASGVATADGTMTQSGVRARIRALVDAEDKAHPLSDDDLMARLKAEGIPLARRTVAKYREAEGLPNSSRRKVRT